MYNFLINHNQTELTIYLNLKQRHYSTFRNKVHLEKKHCLEYISKNIVSIFLALEIFSKNTFLDF